MQLKDLFKRKPPMSMRLVRAGLVSSVLWGAYYGYIQNLPDQEFTEEETVLLTQVFQDSADFSMVNYHRSKQGDTVLRLHAASGLTLGDTFILSTDYQPDTAHYQNTFIHEATHIWQKQNCSFSFLTQLFTRAEHFFSEPDEVYKYRLDATKDLLDYNNEQQASIIADYFNSKRKYPSILLQNKAPEEEVNRLYLAVLDKFLEDPNYIKQQCSFSI